MEDSAIIDLYWAREERALSETDTKYGGYCRSIAHNILQNREDTEECVSDTWLHAWNAMPPQRPSILSSFLGRITRNLSFDRCRRQKAEKRGGGALPLPRAAWSMRWRSRSWRTASTAFCARCPSANAAFSCAGTGTSTPYR